MFEVARVATAAGTVVIAATERDDGDIHPQRVEAAALIERQQALTGPPWTMLDEVHGTDVVVAPVGAAWRPTSGCGDILLAAADQLPIAVWAADCAPVMLIGRDGTVIGVHAGWRGLAAGVVDVAVDTLWSAGTEVVGAVLGPCIRSCCYEFGATDLDAVAAGVGARPGDLDATTRDGRSALDVPTAVAAAVARRGVALTVEGSCTGCDARFFSHRTRRDSGRHALVAVDARHAMMEDT